LRKRFPVFSQTAFFTGDGDVEWIAPSGSAMQGSDWENLGNPLLGMVLATDDNQSGRSARLAILFNRGHEDAEFSLPGEGWQDLTSEAPWAGSLPARSVRFCLEQ
jgi:glycogen operon protein